MKRFYPIGTPGAPWTPAEVATWRDTQRVVRSYRDDVRLRLEKVGAPSKVVRYGALSIDAERYPLLAVMPSEPLRDAPWALITGGVHGYETSGVHGALAAMEMLGPAYEGRINLLVAPCVSPWGYEVIHRWNPYALDPNRSFVDGSQSEEAGALMKLVAELGARFLLHVDLHETTDTDESEFRPALAARDGKAFEPGGIPDGFYLVADRDNPQPAFQAAIISAVEQVTHIAPPDDAGQMIGCPVEQPGVIHYACKPLGLCAGMTGATYATTTEVYPDSATATPAICTAAQVAAVRAALDHALG